jgi:hypothetical protein
VSVVTEALKIEPEIKETANAVAVSFLKQFLKLSREHLTLELLLPNITQSSGSKSLP